MGKVTDYWMNEYNKDKSISMVENLELKLDKIIATSEDIAKTNKEYFGVLKELLEKLVPKPITINQPIYKGKDFDEVKFNEVLKNITNRINKASSVSPRVISKEEFVSRLQEIDVDKLVKKELMKNTNYTFQKVYKKNVKTNDYVLVGYIESNVIEFYPYNERTKPFVPNLYDPNWYVIKDTVRSADGNVYPLFEGVTPNFIEQHPINRKDRSVMGFRAKNGRIVYYDYFI